MVRWRWTSTSSERVLGFSYSLNPDGSPGSHNVTIARELGNRIAADHSAGLKPLLAAQWEIVGALGAMGTDYEGFAVPPPSFDATGYPQKPADPNSVFDYAALNAERLALYLNRFLEDSTFHEGFFGDAELHDLHRTQLGSLGIEQRRMPAPSQSFLGFQKVRVNRLIIESIVPNPAILKRGSYLSTHGVLERVLRHFGERLAHIDQVAVFGFPAHSPRCRRQTIEALWSVGRTINVTNVTDACGRPPEEWATLPWDPGTAQVWCRSRQNWLDYEAMGINRL